MGFGLIIAIILILGAVWYISQNPEILKISNIKNPFDNFIQNNTVYNNTPFSTITYTSEKTYLGKSWVYIDCQNDNDCNIRFGPNSHCEDNQSSSYYKQCFYYKI